MCLALPTVHLRQVIIVRDRLHEVRKLGDQRRTLGLGQELEDELVQAD